MLYSLLGLVVLILDVIAILQVVNSSMDSTKKLIWILVILFLPVLGMVLYYVLNNKSPVA